MFATRLDGAIIVLTTLLTVLFCRGRGSPASSTSFSQLVTRWSSYLVRFSESLFEFLAWQSTSFSPGGPCLSSSLDGLVSRRRRMCPVKLQTFIADRPRSRSSALRPRPSVRLPTACLLHPCLCLSLSLRPRGGPLLRPPRAVLEHVLAAPSLFSPSPSRNGPTRAGMGRASNIGQVFKCRPPALPCPWRTQGYSGRVVWSITRQ